MKPSPLILALLVGVTNLVAQSTPLSITQQPLSQNATPGSTVVLSVAATGDAPSFLWELNGDYIPGATGNQLVLSNVKPADSGTYSVTVFNGSEALESQEAVVLVDAPSLPAADRYGSRGTITGASGVGWADNSNATIELSELLQLQKLLSGSIGSHTMWVKWVAPANGYVTFQTDGSTFDTQLSVFTQGLNLLNLITLLSPVTGDDDGGGYHTSMVHFNAKAGQEYEISVTGWGSEGYGVFYLGWSFVPGQGPPVFTKQPESQTVNWGEPVVFSTDISGASNGLQWFANGSPVAGATGKTLTIASVQDGNIGFYYCQATGPNGVFSYSQTAELQVNTEGSNAGTRNKVEDSILSQLLGVVGGLLKPQSAGHGLHAAGSAGASGYSGTQVFATSPGKDPGEPNHCDVVGGASYWLTYAAPESGRFTLTTDGSTFDTILAVYLNDGKGNGYKSMIPVACDNNSGADHLDSKVVFDVQANVTYYIVLDGVKGATGKAYLNYSLDCLPSISAINNVSINEDQSTGAISFTLNDRETPNNLSISAYASDSSLVPSVSLAGSGTSRSFTIQPAPNKSGKCTIYFTVSDPGGASVSRSIGLTVNAINDPPVAGADCGTRTPGASIKFYIPTLLNNDKDPDGDAITFSSVDAKSTNGGTIVRSGDYVTYTPPANSNATDYFTYKISDGKGGTAAGKVTVSCSSSTNSSVQ